MKTEYKIIKEAESSFLFFFNSALYCLEEISLYIEFVRLEPRFPVSGKKGGKGYRKFHQAAFIYVSSELGRA